MNEARQHDGPRTRDRNRRESLCRPRKYPRRLRGFGRLRRVGRSSSGASTTIDQIVMTAHDVPTSISSPHEIRPSVDLVGTSSHRRSRPLLFVFAFLSCAATFRDCRGCFSHRVTSRDDRRVFHRGPEDAAVFAGRARSARSQHRRDDGNENAVKHVNLSNVAAPTSRPAVKSAAGIITSGSRRSVGERSLGPRSGVARPMLVRR